MKNSKKYFFIFLIVFALVLLIIKILAGNTPKVINSLPSNNQKDVNLNQTIKLTFDKNISGNWLINPSPVFVFQTKEAGKILEIIPDKPLEQNTTYKIAVTNQKFTNFNFELSFKTLLIENIVPEITPSTNEDQARKYYEEWDKEILQTKPLFDFLPYKTSKYLIYYIGPMSLKVIAKEDNVQIRKEVSDWILSKGVDPSTHKINWEVRKELTF